MMSLRFICQVACVCAFSLGLGSGFDRVSEAGEVVLHRQANSIRIMIDGEVFGLYRYGADLPKPYFLPLTVLNAWELWEQAAPGDDTVAGKRAVVCADNLVVNGQPLELGSVVEVTGLTGEFAELKSPAGRVPRGSLAPLAGVVTRLVNPDPPKIRDAKDPRYYDHPHHKGLWLSVDEVNGIKFWNENGRIVSHSVEVLQERGPVAGFKVVNHWLKADGSPLVEETSVFTIFADGLLSQDVTFKAVSEPVVFEDTKEGMFAIRLPNSMREFISQDRVTNAEGVQGTAACWGLESNWVNYLGKVDGQLLGVTLFDHRDNPRRSRYHVRDYGLFAISPFGPHSYSKGALPHDPLHLEPGGPGARFRYAVLLSRGELTPEQLNRRHTEFSDAIR
jgi:hypothetical protein